MKDLVKRRIPAFDDLGYLILMDLDEYLKNGGDPHSDACPIVRYGKWSTLQVEFRLQYEEDHQVGFLAVVISTCAEEGWPLPDWAATAFLEAHNAIKKLDAKSWDEIFGQPLLPGKHQHAQRKARVIAPEVFGAVRDLTSQSEHAIDEATFEEVGRRFHISAGQARKYYYTYMKKLDVARKMVEIMDAKGRKERGL